MGVTYGVIVKKSLTQALLKDPAVSKYVIKGKGLKTAGPVEPKHLSGIICSLKTAIAAQLNEVPPDQMDQYRLVYLNGLPDAEKVKSVELNVASPCFLCQFEQEMDPSQLSLHDALAAILPSGSVIPSAYETIGHIAHLNLLPEHLPFKEKIGALILEKHPAIKTVVNKRHELDSEFRNCPLELIGGKPNYIATHIEHGLRFHIDYENVFWNSRLSGERFRLTSKIPKGSDVFDVMGGVGGFGIYLAKFNQCHVVTNDLNKVAHECATQNIVLNKVSSLVRSCNMDAREFIREMINPKFGQSCLFRPLGFQSEAKSDSPVAAAVEDVASGEGSDPKKRRLDQSVLDRTDVYFLMNLPKIAIDFLDAFKGVYDRKTLPGPLKEPHVLVYCFASPQDFATAIPDRIRSVVGAEAFLLCEIVEITPVRNVSPSKNQYCVDLKLSIEFLRYSEA